MFGMVNPGLLSTTTHHALAWRQNLKSVETMPAKLPMIAAHPSFPTNTIALVATSPVSHGQRRTNVYGGTVHHFRGIPYGCVTTRFAAAALVPSLGSSGQDLIDCTEFGPICPQPEVDIGHLLRLPPSGRGQQPRCCEFQCLNLNVHCPSEVSAISRLPVIIWIHGGSQVVTFAPASEPVCDPSRLVAQSIEIGKPLIFVTVNYRLNIFAFGDATSDTNLALKDQRLAIDWVRKNIADFGGDPGDITLAGQSAGAVYTHAHILTDAPLRRAIIVSGSLHLSPPLPPVVGAGLLEKLERAVEKIEPGASLRIAHPAALIESLKVCGVSSMWLQEDASLVGWRERDETVQSLLLSDVEYESVLWRNGIELAPVEHIAEAFAAAGDYSARLSQLYHVDVTRPSQTRHAALDFLNDARFALPSKQITDRWEAKQRSVYQYLVDEPNPWQASSRAHHGVDLIMLFGGVDLRDNPAADATGRRLRDTWITFASGHEPWPVGVRFAFGPHGRHGPISEEEYALRRRTLCLDFLDKAPLAAINAVFSRLAAGRMNLLN